MAQQIKQNGQAVIVAPGDNNPTCAIIFNLLTEKNQHLGSDAYESYLSMMFHDFPGLTYGEIELWEDGKFKQKGNINK